MHLKAAQDALAQNKARFGWEEADRAKALAQEQAQLQALPGEFMKSATAQAVAAVRKDPNLEEMGRAMVRDAGELAQTMAGMGTKGAKEHADRFLATRGGEIQQRLLGSGLGMIRGKIEKTIEGGKAIVALPNGASLDYTPLYQHLIDSLKLAEKLPPEQGDLAAKILAQIEQEFTEITKDKIEAKSGAEAQFNRIAHAKSFIAGMAAQGVHLDYAGRLAAALEEGQITPKQYDSLIGDALKNQVPIATPDGRVIKVDADSVDDVRAMLAEREEAKQALIKAQTSREKAAAFKASMEGAVAPIKALRGGSKNGASQADKLKIEQTKHENRISEERAKSNLIREEQGKDSENKLKADVKAGGFDPKDIAKRARDLGLSPDDLDKLLGG